MGLFPLFLNLTNKKCVVIGGGRVAYRKILTLLKYEAYITLISPDIYGPIVQLKHKIKIVKRQYQHKDLNDAYMVLACACETVNLQVYESLDKSIYFNCARPSEKSNFIFPAVVTRGDLSIGISTNTASPALSSNIRKQIDAILPENMDVFIKILADFRLKVMNEVEMAEARAFILKRAVELIDYNIKPEEYTKNILELLRNQK